VPLTLLSARAGDLRREVHLAVTMFEHLVGLARGTAPVAVLQEPSGNGGPVKADVPANAHYRKWLLAARACFLVHPTVAYLEPLRDFCER